MPFLVVGEKRNTLEEGNFYSIFIFFSWPPFFQITLSGTFPRMMALVSIFPKIIDDYAHWDDSLVSFSESRLLSYPLLSHLSEISHVGHGTYSMNILVFVCGIFAFP